MDYLKGFLVGASSVAVIGMIANRCTSSGFGHEDIEKDIAFIDQYRKDKILEEGNIWIRIGDDDPKMVDVRIASEILATPSTSLFIGESYKTQIVMCSKRLTRHSCIRIPK